MTTSTYQSFLVKGESQQGVILYRGDRPLLIFVNDEAQSSALARFLFETLDVSERATVSVLTKKELAGIELEVQGNSHLLPRLPYPSSVLKTYFAKE